MAGIRREHPHAGQRIATAIVGYADLTRPREAAELLDAEIEAAGGAFRGVRQGATWDDHGFLHTRTRTFGPDLYGRADFREGLLELAGRGLSFDAWQFYYQLPALTELAHAVPQAGIVVNHTGGVVGVGPYAGRRDEIFAAWRDNVRALAECPNVSMKLGGLGMKNAGFDFPDRATPASSEALAQAWRPYIETCIEAFGAERCMFESNFPIDQTSCSYRTLWNAFKRIAGQASATEKAWLFHDAASRFYRLTTA
jgi:predicted TIM-barrel fold metal-dependent hydrolase